MDKPIVEAFIDAINAHNTERMAALTACDLLLNDASGNRTEGRAAMREVWRNRFAQAPDFRIEVEHRIAGKERVALFGHASGTYPAGGGHVQTEFLEENVRESPPTSILMRLTRASGPRVPPGGG